MNAVVGTSGVITRQLGAPEGTTKTIKENIDTILGIMNETNRLVNDLSFFVGCVNESKNELEVQRTNLWDDTENLKDVSDKIRLNIYEICRLLGMN